MQRYWFYRGRFGPGKRAVAAVAVIVTIVALLGGPAGASVKNSGTLQSCGSLLVPQHSVAGHTFGESSCVINAQSTVMNASGVPFNEVDMGISGTAFGYADPVTLGNTRKDLADAPNVLFPQFGITQWLPGVGTYSGTPTATDAGSGITVLYPQNVADWNGKIFVLAHGQANDTPLGDLVPRNAADPLNTDSFTNLYAGLMIDAGYAVIYTRREGASGVSTTLDNGQVLNESLNDNVRMILDFMQTGKKLIEQQMARPASEVYAYGHSAGEILWRVMQYSFGQGANGVDNLNIGPNGKPYINGVLGDDPGGGLPLPVSMPQGQVLGDHGNLATFDPHDMLFQTPLQRAEFVPELTLAHQLYQDTHVWLPTVTYLDLKLEGAKLYEQEDMGDKTRLYQIDGVSHIANTTTSPPNTLELGGMIPSLVQLLDQWVTKGVAPPPTMADLAAVGGHTMPRMPSSVQLPPVACPTGFRFSGPPPGGASSSTGYVPFDGVTLEPVNANGVLQDFNGDGYRDAMPTMQQAWQQLGLLRPHQAFTKQTFMDCVQRSVSQLVALRLIGNAVANAYVQKATAFPNLTW